MHAALRRVIGEAIAWHGWHYHIKGISRVAAVATRIREQGDDFVHLEERSGPAVGDDQGHGVGPLAWLMDEVYPQPLDRGLVVLEGVEPLLLGSPVKAGTPVCH